MNCTHSNHFWALLLELRNATNINRCNPASSLSVGRMLSLSKLQEFKISVSLWQANWVKYSDIYAWAPSSTECTQMSLFESKIVWSCQGLFHPVSRFLAWTWADNFHQVLNGKKSSDIFSSYLWKTWGHVENILPRDGSSLNRDGLSNQMKHDHDVWWLFE